MKLFRRDRREAAQALPAPAREAAIDLGALAGIRDSLLAAEEAVRRAGAPALPEPGPEQRRASADSPGAAELAWIAELAARLRAEAEGLAPARDPGDAAALEDARLILPLAKSVIASVSPETEKAAMSLIERFGAVQEAAERSSRSSRELLDLLEGRGAAASTSAIAERSRAAIKVESSEVSRIVDSNRRDATKLRTMAGEIEQGIVALREIEEINDRSRLIAFNMAVEAARIGEKGRGFRVIVNEMRRLNDQTAAFSETIVATLKRLQAYGTDLVAEMDGHSARLKEEVLGGVRASEEAVEALIGATSATEGMSRQLANIGLEVRSQLDRVIEALQFQDITHQMLEGATRMLGDAEAALGRASGPAGGGAGSGEARRRRFEELRSHYASKAKTRGEKDAMKEARP